MLYFGKKNNVKLKKSSSNDNSRLNIVMAIVFFLMLSVIARLYTLQIKDNDLYVALASSQHEVYKELRPERGRIFVKDGPDGGEDKFYPVAVNKEFATIYAIPKKINNPKEVSEGLYEIFEKVKVEKEVEEFLKKDSLFASSTENLSEDKIVEFKNIKREMEINLRKDKIIENYITRLSKKNDPYEPIAKKVDEELLNLVKEKNYEGIEYVMDVHRYYPDKNIGSHYLGFLGYRDGVEKGLYGLEGFFNEEISGKSGSIKSERSADGKTVIVNDREFYAPINGADIFLTINRSIQFEACRELKTAADKYGAEGGSIIVMDPFTGKIIAMCSYPDYDPNDYGNVSNVDIYNNPVIFDSYEPGSIFKAITVSSGIDEGKISPTTVYNDSGYVMIEGWNKPIRNSDYEQVGGHGIVDMTTVLEKSLNTGTIFIVNQIGSKEFSDKVKEFGFGEKTGIELETEGYSNIENLKRNYLRPIEVATASFGQGITATPLQMAVAYSAIANGGILMKPYIVSDIIFANGEKQTTTPKQIRRVVSERSALLTTGMLVKVVDNGHAKLASVPGYYVAGKTGTAQVADKGGYGDKTVHTFVGYAPADEPKFVMLIRLDHPTNVQFSASSAAPVFGKIAKFILDFYQVPKER